MTKQDDREMAEADEIMTMERVAERLHVCRKTLQRIIQDHPYYRQVGRRKIFTEADFQRLVEALPCPSNSCPQAHDTATGSTMPSSLSKAGAAKSRRARETKAMLAGLQNSSSKSSGTVASLDLARRARSQRG